MSATVLSLQNARESIQVCPLADKRLERVELRKRQLAVARKDLASVIPVEGTTVREVIQQRVELLECAVEDPTFEERYPYLSLEVLGWRDGQGFPKLVPFSLNDPMFSILAVAGGWMSQGERWQTGGSITQLPQPMAKKYNDILDKFYNECREDAQKYEFASGLTWRKSITSRFSGVIPQWVRERIQLATADFSVSTPRMKVRWLRKSEVTEIDVTASIFFIAEVDEWVVNKEVVPRSDPLVVGYKAGCLWLICSFDETPLEEYVRREISI